MRRRLHHRRGARLVVLADDAVLLIADSDPGVPESRWWVTPGGGIDPGEDVRAAAAREAQEETGLPVDPARLEGPVAVRVAVHGYSDRVLVQHETFFRLRVERFRPDTKAWSASEHRRLQGFKWHPVGELPEQVWPAELGRLIGWRGGEPLELGVADESTVPLTSSERQRVEHYLRGLGFFRSP